MDFLTPSLITWYILTIKIRPEDHHMIVNQTKSESNQTISLNPVFQDNLYVSILKISKVSCETFNSPFSKSIALCFTNLHLCDLFNICPQSAMFARNLFSQFSQRLNFRRWKGFWNFGAPPPPLLQAKSTKKYLARHLRTKTNKTVFPLNFLKSYSLQEKMSFTGTIISQKLQQNF